MLPYFYIDKERMFDMSDLDIKAIPGINTVDGFNPADFVRRSTNADGSTSVYLEAKFRILWFRLHHPNGKLDTEIVRLDDKSACVCCRVYTSKDDPPEQYISKAYSHRYCTEESFGDRFLEIAETIAKGRALADAGYGTQFCFSGDTFTEEIADSPMSLPPEDDLEQPLASVPAAAVLAPPEPEPEPGPAAAKTPVQAAEAEKPAAPKTLQELIDTMTVEEAKGIKVDFGRYAGCTLGQIAVIRPGDLAWYVKNYTGHNIALKAGANVLLRAAEKLAS